MPLLFSYGTLRQPAVQRATFGRLLEGASDELPGFEPSSVKIEDSEGAVRAGHSHHANAVRTGRAGSRVKGTVYEVSDAELAAADEYERQAGYARLEVSLASGKRAWLYVDARALRR